MVNQALRKRLLEPGFRYYKAAETDIRRTFKRAMKEQDKPLPSNVKKLERKA